MYKILFFFIMTINILKAEDQPFVHFSHYQQTYFIFGSNDLKMQFSFKYRLADSTPLYFGFTQTMFWNIYNGSKPFSDINYAPEIFYRIKFTNSDFKDVDLGYLHLSNGMKDANSRSLDRLIVKSNYEQTFKERTIALTIIFYQIYNTDHANSNIVRHLGYWELRSMITKLITHQKGSLDFETRLFAGKKIADLSNGAYQLGFIYNFGSLNLNPSIYIQYYNGYNEKLLDYDVYHAKLRLGLLLSF